MLVICAAACLWAPACDDGGGDADADADVDADGDADSDSDGDGDGDSDADEERCTGDEQCDDGEFCNGAEACDPGSDDADDFGCAPGAPPCAEGETCDESTAACLPDCEYELDSDGDGHVTVDCGGDDCDDFDVNTYPGNVEVCDGEGHDEDCNPETFGFIDADGDGTASAVCCNGTICGDDCNDADINIGPRSTDGRPSACDGIDNDCDGTTDEGCPCVEGETRECGTAPQLDHVGTCEPGVQYCIGGAFTEECSGGVAPQEEVCDGLDNDCDGADDDGVLRTYYEDVDGDGYGTAAATRSACSPEPGWAPNTDDCDDAALGVNPAAVEVCNDVDDNCDGLVDEGLLRPFYHDFDGDGYGDPADAVTACYAPDGYVTDGTDCDDGVRGVSPAAPERCDGIDNDCDTTIDPGCECEEGATRACGETAEGECTFGTQRCIAGVWAECVGAVAPRAESCNGADDDCDTEVDEGVQVTFYLDADGDGFGAAATSVQACARPAGYSALSTDCDDATSAVNPAAVERCNGRDDNCAGGTDEGCDCTDGATRDCGTTAPGGGILTTGECEAGTQVCVGGAWGACIGDVAPAPEACNGLDDDCDGTSDEGTTASCYADGDTDGYGTGVLTTVCAAAGGGCPTGWAASAGDCNDGNASVRPGATEVCNGVNDNCDAATDNGAGMVCVQGTSRSGTGAFGACGSVSGVYVCNSNCLGETFVPTPPAESCDGLDNDCDGAADDGFTCVRSSTGNACTTACSTLGTYTCSGTCTAGACRTAGEGPTYPGTCNGCDDDGDGALDDGFTCRLGQTGSCTTGCGTSGSRTCLTDCSAWGVCRAASETCNDCDDDGDGATDEDFTCRRATTRACDVCGAVAGGTQECLSDCSGYTACHRTEVCNGCDDDADGSIDEGVLTTYYQDNDGDGYGSSVSTTACSRPAGYSLIGGDCDDTRAGVHPGAAEVCDRLDTDCDGTDPIYEDFDNDGYGTTDTTICFAGPRGNSDCDDDNSSINPGIITFSSTYAYRYCAVGWLCVLGGNYYCHSGMGFCNVSDPAALYSWDYNCDGVDEHRPLAGACSHSTLYGCSGTGFIEAGACGESVDYHTCADDPISPHCDETLTHRAMECR
jgi:hypothetical protein